MSGWKFWEWESEDEKHQRDASDFTARAQELIKQKNASTYLDDAKGLLSQAGEAAGGVFNRALNAGSSEFSHMQVPETYSAAKQAESSGDIGGMVQKSAETAGRVAMSAPGAATNSIDSILGEVGLSREKLGFDNPLQHIGLAEQGAKVGIADFATAGLPFLTKAAGALGKTAEAVNTLQNIGFAGNVVAEPLSPAGAIAGAMGFGKLKGLAPVVPAGTETLAGKYQSDLKGINTGVEFLLKDHVERPPFPDARVDDMSSHIKILTDELDGATYNPFTGNANGTSQYSVSIFPERSLTIEGKPSESQIKDYIENNKNLLRDPRVSVGTWFNEGKTSLDLVLTVPDEPLAKELGQHFNQLAVYDLKNAKEIPIEGTTGGLRDLDIWGKNDKWYVGKPGEGDLEHRTVSIGPGGLISLDDAKGMTNHELAQSGYKGVYYPGTDQVDLFEKVVKESVGGKVVTAAARIFGSGPKSIIPISEAEKIPISPVKTSQIKAAYGDDVFEAINSSENANWGDSGLALKLERFQNPGVAGLKSPRGGVFYGTPESAADYKTGGTPADFREGVIGGSEKVDGWTLYKNPVVIVANSADSLVNTAIKDEKIIPKSMSKDLVTAAEYLSSAAPSDNAVAAKVLVEDFGFSNEEVTNLEKIHRYFRPYAVKELYLSKWARDNNVDGFVGLFPDAKKPMTDVSSSASYVDDVLYWRDSMHGAMSTTAKERAKDEYEVAVASMKKALNMDASTMSTEALEKLAADSQPKKNLSIFEVFDTREDRYPSPEGEFSMFDVFRPLNGIMKQVPASVYRAGAQGAASGGIEGFQAAQEDPNANPFDSAMAAVAGMAVGGVERTAARGALNKLGNYAPPEAMKQFTYTILKNGPQVPRGQNIVEKIMYSSMLSASQAAQAVSLAPEVLIKIGRDALSASATGHPDRVMADFIGLGQGLFQGSFAFADGMKHALDKGFFEVPSQLIEAIDLASRTTLFGMQVGYNAAKDAEKMGLSMSARHQYVLDALKDPVGTNYYIKEQAGATRGTYMPNFIDPATGLSVQPGTKGAVPAETGKFGQWLAKGQEMPAIQFIFPFVSTVHRMATRGIEMSPLGLIGTGFDYARGVYDTAKPTIGKRAFGDITNVNPDLEERLGNNVIGSAMFAWFFQQAMAGGITGAGPADQSHKEALVRQGWQPYSVRLPDGKYLDYRKFGVAAELLAFAAMPAEVIKYGKDDDTKMRQGIVAFAGLADEMTYLRGMTEIIRAFQEGSFESTLESAAMRMIPYGAFLNTVANSIDPSMREIHGIGDQLKAEIPGPLGRESLPKALDTYGNVRPNARSGLAAIAPTRVTVEHQNKIDQEMIRLDIAAGRVQDTINMPDGTERKLTNPEIHQYQLVAGEGKREALAAIVGSKAYDEADDKTKKSMIRTVILHASSWGKEAVVPEAVKDAELGRYGGDPTATAQGLVKAIQTKQDLEKLAANKYSGKTQEQALIIDDDKQTLAAYKMAMGEALGDQAFIAKYGYLKYTQAKFIKPTKQYSTQRKEMIVKNPEYNKFFGSSLDPSEVQSTRTLIPA